MVGGRRSASTLRLVSSSALRMASASALRLASSACMRKYNLETFFHILIWPPLPPYVDTYVCKFCFFPYAIRSLFPSQSLSLFTYIFPPLSLYHSLFLSPSQALPTPIPALSLAASALKDILKPQYPNTFSLYIHYILTFENVCILLCSLLGSRIYTCVCVCVCVCVFGHVFLFVYLPAGRRLAKPPQAATADTQPSSIRR